MHQTQKRDNNNNIHLYTAHITWFHGGFQFCKGEIGRQHIEGASGCRFNPYVISPHPPRPRTTSPTLYEQWMGSLMSHRA